MVETDCRYRAYQVAIDIVIEGTKQKLLAMPTDEFNEEFARLKNDRCIVGDSGFLLERIFDQTLIERERRASWKESRI